MIYEFIKTVEDLTGDGLSKCLIVIVLSLIFYWSHSKVFEYLKNKGSIFLTLMLPIIILIVTQTISTNLYLSLGLIGALSVVRYRTPVKSQYELAYIFGLIAIGLVTGVNPVYAAVLTTFLSILPAYILSKFILIISSSISNEENRFRRINVQKIASLKDLFNNPIDEVIFDLKSLDELEEVSKMIVKPGNTMININIKNKEIGLNFKLENKRNLDRKTLNLLRNKEISAIIK